MTILLYVAIVPIRRRCSVAYAQAPSYGVLLMGPKLPKWSKAEMPLNGRGRNEIEMEMGNGNGNGNDGVGGDFIG